MALLMQVHDSFPFGAMRDHVTGMFRVVTSGELLIPPPAPNWRTRTRRLWRSREALPRLQRWLLRLVPGFLGLVALYLLNGFLNGWAQAYNLLVTITSPGDVRQQLCAWPLSLAGWAVMPALIGGAVGYIVTTQIDTHRTQELAEVLDELRRYSIPQTDEEG
ncbi:DUF6313 family protein [Streptomyces sp. NPDC013187]|uniref:DUF6313 family protein n=1 Tax=Streptomyces sp. NPDC013187 TaxID=3364865 RepID=UPI00367CD535